MAKVLGTSGRASEAIETYQRVIKILESSRGDGEELIVPLCALGNLLIKEGKTSDAEYIFNRLVLCIMDEVLLHSKPVFILMMKERLFFHSGV